MSKEEKQNVIVALLLCVAAVIILWLWARGGTASFTTPAASDTYGFPPVTSETPETGYTNYNIPAYQPPGINIGGNTTQAANTGGCGCGVPCGPPGTYLGNGWTVANYLQYAGP